MRSLVTVLALAFAVVLHLPAAASMVKPAELGPQTAAEPPAEVKEEARAESETEALKVVATSQGKASFYAKRAHGRRTASGESHDAQALTAAHRSLPFGTWVRVRSVQSGQEVTVRINDRGPFIRGRVIDLSHAAAEALGILQAGTHMVVLEVLGAP